MLDFFEFFFPYFYKAIFSILHAVTVALAYYFVDKKKGEKVNSNKYLLVFLFGIFYVIYDLCKRLFSNKEKFNKWMAIIIAVYIASYLSFCVGLPKLINLDEAKVDAIFDAIDDDYYDMNRFKYDELDDVVYYTREGYEYTCNTNIKSFSSVGETEYKSYYEQGYAYVDEDGYILFTDKVLECVGNDRVFNFYDRENNKYYMLAEQARWDDDGNLTRSGYIGFAE